MRPPPHYIDKHKENFRTASADACYRNTQLISSPTGSKILTRHRFQNGWGMFVLPLSVAGVTQPLADKAVATQLNMPAVNTPTLVSVKIHFPQPTIQELAA